MAGALTGQPDDAAPRAFSAVRSIAFCIMTMTLRGKKKRERQTAAVGRQDTCLPALDTRRWKSSGGVDLDPADLARWPDGGWF